MVNPTDNNLFKKIVNSDGFKIYFWPIAIYQIIIMIAFATFGVGENLEPDSRKEMLFVITNSILFIILLWTLAKRYKNVKSKSLNKRTIIMLSVLTAIMSVGIVIIIISLFLSQQNI